METVETATQMQALLGKRKGANEKIGFVPTMGALHEGHLALIDRSIAENDVTVLSIFVNPTQFNSTSDFEKYPKDLEVDLKTLGLRPVDYLFLPKKNDLYLDAYNYSVHEKTKNEVLCGATRPGHFQGVLTVILKLLHITLADRIYLGEKDFQQLEIIRGMVEAFFIPVEVIGVPTVRDEHGLALSSRNQRLSPAGIEKARRFAQLLKSTEALPRVRAALQREDIKVDYLEEMWGRRFAAVFVEDVRLIDNVPID